MHVHYFLTSCAGISLTDRYRRKTEESVIFMVLLL